MNAATALTAWWRECVTEAIKVWTIRRNAIFVIAMAALATPWAIMALFRWLRGQGVPSTGVLVAAIASRARRSLWR